MLSELLFLRGGVLIVWEEEEATSAVIGCAGELRDGFKDFGKGEGRIEFV